MSRCINNKQRIKACCVSLLAISPNINYHNRRQSNISPGQLSLFQGEDYLIVSLF